MLLSELPMFLLLIYSVTSVDMDVNKRILRRNTEVTRTFNLNRPPSVENYDSIPVTVVYDDQEVIKVSTNLASAPIVNNDYEEDTLYKLKARSVKITEPVRAETDAEIEPISRPKTQRIRSQVRKLKVNNSQLNAYLNETETGLNKQEDTTVKIDQTGTSESSTQIPKRGQTFEKRTQLRDPVIPIIESESYVFSHAGNFHYSYESGDGTRAFEKGELKTSNGGTGSAVEGNFSYKDKDGNDFSLSYTADENGYRPVGAHLPTPPPIPPAIQRALDLLATKTTPEPITERIKLYE